ncbi:hypothetical protein G7K_6866-t1 [Saitoella complicata NRRL Y-17804]|uniref:Uncharacterized protein n=1 Tax=Saitoella complicata (strain BCRC 22490 / CBS 7301 / JCM 7358 / NBRC 10748 / NRRL Y-17804) TaxID=698492 RepID=A0A0E9NSG2_SAICN|nr:hypothetical protein G7K_6866-t1 [Saitoella complicata NRRL Y-17804]
MSRAFFLFFPYPVPVPFFPEDGKGREEGDKKHLYLPFLPSLLSIPLLYFFLLLKYRKDGKGRNSTYSFKESKEKNDILYSIILSYLLNPLSYPCLIASNPSLIPLRGKGRKGGNGLSSFLKPLYLFSLSLSLLISLSSPTLSLILPLLNEQGFLSFLSHPVPKGTRKPLYLLPIPLSIISSSLFLIILHPISILFLFPHLPSLTPYLAPA